MPQSPPAAVAGGGAEGVSGVSSATPVLLEGLSAFAASQNCTPVAIAPHAAGMGCFGICTNRLTNEDS